MNHFAPHHSGYLPYPFLIREPLDRRMQVKKNFHYHVIVYIRPIELVGGVNNQRTHARHLYRLEKLETNWNEFRIQLIYYLSAFRIVANADGLIVCYKNSLQDEIS